jgi:hypothetical protein
MLYLVLILASMLLWMGFLGLTVVEARTGARLLENPRRALDRRVQRVSFLANHVHWGNFISHVLGSLIERIAHDIAHGTLIAVRFVEHELTRTVRYLRSRRPNLLAPRPSRRSPLAQTSEYVRKMLRLPRTKK